MSDQAKVVPAFRKWLRDLRAAFPPNSPGAHFFGARSHGNENDAWCAAGRFLSLVALGEADPWLPALLRRYNASQISWLVGSDGTLLVNEVIKLEELAEKWEYLGTKICGLAGVPYADGGLRRNPSAHGHYSVRGGHFDSRRDLPGLMSDGGRLCP